MEVWELGLVVNTTLKIAKEHRVQTIGMSIWPGWRPGWFSCYVQLRWFEFGLFGLPFLDVGPGAEMSSQSSTLWLPAL